VTDDDVKWAIIILADTMQKMVPEGRIRSATITVTDTPQLLGETDWFSATLYNEGPDDLYIFDQFQTPRVGFDGAIKPGRSLFVDCRSKTGKQKYIVCASGKTCEVTVFRMW